MTSATNPGNYVDFDEYVGLKLEKTRSTIRTTDLLTAAAGVAAMFLGYLLIFVVLDQWVVRDGFGVFWRWILLSTLMISTIAWLVWKVGIPSFQTVNGLFAAQEIEKSEPELKSNLLNLVDLKTAGRSVNPAILRAIERQAAVRLQQVDVAQAIDHRPLVRSAYVLLAIIITFCFYAMLSPKKISNSIWRAMLPAAQVPLATITEILDVKPGDITVPAHQPFVEVQVDLAGEIPPQVLLLFSTADGKHDQPVELRPEQEGQPRFRGQLIGENGQGLVQELTYFIRAGDATSKQYKISVEQPPYADVESVRIEFPSYMKLQPIEQINNGAVDAWEGARVVVNAKTNMPIRSGMIQFLDDPQVGPTGEEVVMSVTSGGRQIQATWTLALRSNGTFPKYYRIHCRTEDGRVTTGHVINPLTIRPDLPPEIMLLQPDRDLDAPANATIPLLIQARDPDFELGYLYLNVEKAGQKILREQLSEGRQPKLVLTHELALGRFNPAIDDTFEIWIEAYDNKQPRPNSKNTPKLKIRIVKPVSPKEAEQQLAEQNQRRDQKLAEADLEKNPDRSDGAPPKEGDPKDRQNRDNARPNDADPKQQQESPQDGRQDQAGQVDQKKGSKGGSGQSTDSQRKEANKTTSQSDPGNGQTEKDSKPNKSLNNDGSQDDEAIRKISEQMNKSQKANSPNDQPAAEKTEQARSANEKTQPNQPSQTPEGKSDAGKTQLDKKQAAGGNPDKSDGNNSAANPSKPGSDSDESKPAATDSKPDSRATNQKKLDQKPQDENSQTDKSSSDTDQKQKPATKSDGNDKPDGAENGPDHSGEKPAKKSTGDKNAASDTRQKPDQDQQQGLPAKKTVDNESPSGETEPNNNAPKSADGKTSGQKPSGKENTPASKDGGSKSQPDGASDQADKSPEKSAGARNESKSDLKGKSDSTQQESESNPQKPEKQKLGNEPNGSSDPQEKNSTADKNGGQGKNDGGKSASDTKEPAPGDQPSKAQSDKKTQDKSSPAGDKTSDEPTSKNEKSGQGDKPSSENKSANSKPVGDQPSGDKNSEGKPAGQNAAKRDDKSDNGQSGQRVDKNDGQGAQKPANQPNNSSDQKPNSADEKKDGDPKNAAPKSDSPTNSKPGEKSSDGGQSNANSKEPSKGDGSSETQPTDSKSADKPVTPGGKPSGEPAVSDEKSNADQSEKPSSDLQQSKTKSKKDGEARDNGNEQKSTATAKNKNEKKGGDQSKAAAKESGTGEEKPPGSSANPESKKAGDEGKDGESKGDQGSKPGESKSGGKPSPSGSPSAKPGGQNTSNGQGRPSNSGDGTASRGGDTPAVPQSDDANLEYNRQATELILQKLKKDLERGDVDPELLEQLGWTPAEMKRFADRLSKSLQDSKNAEETPEAKARQQQFQEMLKNLDLKKSGTQRTGESEPKRDLNQIESKRIPPPPAYRDAFNKFTRDSARQKPPTSGKPAK